MNTTPEITNRLAVAYQLILEAKAIIDAEADPEADPEAAGDLATAVAAGRASIAAHFDLTAGHATIAAQVDGMADPVGLYDAALPDVEQAWPADLSMYGAAKIFDQWHTETRASNPDLAAQIAKTRAAGGTVSATLDLEAGTIRYVLHDLEDGDLDLFDTVPLPEPGTDHV